jgi:hypothetical protein
MSRPNILRVYLLSLVAGLLLSNCTQTSTSEEAAGEGSNQSDSAQAQVGQDSVPRTHALRFEDIKLDEDLVPLSDSLKKYFDPSQVAMLNNAVAEFKAIKSAEQLANFYMVTLRDSVQPMVERQFQAGCKHADAAAFADDDWDWLSESFPSISTRASCRELEAQMECVHNAPINLLPLKKLAVKTPEYTDDRFFDAQIAIRTDTEPGGPVELMEVFDVTDEFELRQTVGCDTCVVSLLGDGYRAATIRRLGSAAAARKTFNKAVTADIIYLFEGLKDEYYFSDKQTVLAEVDQIIATGKEKRLLGPNELASLAQTRTWIEQKESGFDCGKGACFASN